MDDALRQLMTSASALYSARDFSRLRPILEQIVEHHDGFADMHCMLGVVYHDAGLFSKAQKAFERALALNPRYTEAALNLSVLYNDLGKYSEARATYARALAFCRTDAEGLDPFVSGKLANLHAELAEAYQAAGKTDEAIAEFHKALALRPTFADIRARLASLHCEAGRFGVAHSELERALEDRPEFVIARVQLGGCCYAMGKREEAVRHWTDVAKKYPDDTHAAMYLRMVPADPSRAANALDHG